VTLEITVTGTGDINPVHPGNCPEGLPQPAVAIARRGLGHHRRNPQASELGQVLADQPIGAVHPVGEDQSAHIGARLRKAPRDEAACRASR